MAGRKVIDLDYERALREAEAQGETPHGFYVQTEHGPVHVNGDPRMDDETTEALQHVIELAYRQLARLHGEEEA